LNLKNYLLNRELPIVGVVDESSILEYEFNGKFIRSIPFPTAC